MQEDAMQSGTLAGPSILTQRKVLERMLTLPDDARVRVVTVWVEHDRRMREESEADRHKRLAESMRQVQERVAQADYRSPALAEPNDAAAGGGAPPRAAEHLGDLNRIIDVDEQLMAISPDTRRTLFDLVNSWDAPDLSGSTPEERRTIILERFDRTVR